ncbi:hypothetical protein QJS04_geneDACA002946 [Acorus gramineus]|uniref:Uncharacterized protein n=1 Tax=Acorus gramineus TaxID=55184 RepID=A0AAV9BU93_ACOGR|nr:hypothetical protein QJS04_geneDACA002946 [Acorus gramineus]
MAFRSSSISIATIFLLALVMTTVDSRVLMSDAPPPPGGPPPDRDERGTTFTPPSPQANRNRDPGNSN